MLTLAKAQLVTTMLTLALIGYASAPAAAAVHIEGQVQAGGAVRQCGEVGQGRRLRDALTESSRTSGSISVRRPARSRHLRQPPDNQGRRGRGGHPRWLEVQAVETGPV